MATHSTILVWKTQWTGEPGEYGPWGHKESNKTEQLNTHTRMHTHTHTYTHILYIHTYIYIYTLFCIFFPIMVYHGILNIVPCYTVGRYSLSETPSVLVLWFLAYCRFSKIYQIPQNVLALCKR